MSEDLFRAYRAEIRATEDRWFDEALAKDQLIFGSSAWDFNSALLRGIQQKHGISPDDPRVHSVAAYSAEFREIRDAWDRLVREKQWTELEPKSEEFKVRWRAQVRFEFLENDCLARHFPGMKSGQVDSLPDLWARIAIRIWSIANATSRIYPQDPRVWNDAVRQAYSLLHVAQVRWAPAPPYPKFTESEAKDEMYRISNKLEEDDNNRVAQLAIAQAVLTRTASKKKVTKPSEDAFAAFRASLVVGLNQKQLASYLSQQLGRPIRQGTVSRWLKQVDNWLRAGNILPNLPQSARQRPLPMDPTVLDVGARTDRRTRRQRDRRKE